MISYPSQIQHNRIQHFNKNIFRLGAGVFVLFFTFLTTSCLSPKLVEPAPSNTFVEKFAEKPKNIILMIGDGMGLAQISAAIYSKNHSLNFEAFKNIGFIKQHSYDNLITDSAAGATAFSCGVKTFNGAIGVDADTIPCKTILEEAEENGLATGMIVTSSIVHATPAAFIAHQKSRAFFEQIAMDFMDSDIDFFLGGGKKYFDRRACDDRDLYKELKQKGYYISDYFRKNLSRIKLNTQQNFGYFAADTQPLPVTRGRTYLSYASSLAANFLKQRSEKGFFLMIEGSQIDWAGHANEKELIVEEMIDFDKAIGEMLMFAKKHKDTLIIVTADHEAGGLAINPGSKFRRLKLEFTTKSHTGTMIPVFAFGPGADKFNGIYDNTEVYKKMKAAFGF